MGVAVIGRSGCGGSGGIGGGEGRKKITTFIETLLYNIYLKIIKMGS